MDIITTVTELAQHAKYPLLFVIYIIEGPIANFISSVVASTGALNVYIVFILVLIAEVVMDWVFYLIGYIMIGSKLDKRLEKFEKNGFWKQMKEIFITHPVRALAIVKFIGGISVPGIMYMARIRAIKPIPYAIWATILCLVKNALITFIGYNLGIGVGKFMLAYNFYQVAGVIVLIVILGVVLFRVYEKQITQFVLNIFKKIK